MSGSTFDLLEMLSNLPADQLADVGKLIDQAKQKVSDNTKIPVQVDLHIDVNDDETLDLKELHAALSKASGAQAPPLMLNELADLQKAQPALLEWIGSSKENAALFAADPVRALRKSAAPIDNTLLEKLEHLNRGFKGFTTFAGIPIKSVVLQAKPSSEASVEKKHPDIQPSSKDDKTQPSSKDQKKGGK